MTSISHWGMFELRRNPPLAVRGFSARGEWTKPGAIVWVKVSPMSEH